MSGNWYRRKTRRSAGWLLRDCGRVSLELWIAAKFGWYWWPSWYSLGTRTRDVIISMCVLDICPERKCNSLAAQRFCSKVVIKRGRALNLTRTKKKKNGYKGTEHIWIEHITLRISRLSCWSASACPSGSQHCKRRGCPSATDPFSALESLRLACPAAPPIRSLDTQPLLHGRSALWKNPHTTSTELAWGDSCWRFLTVSSFRPALLRGWKYTLIVL